MMSFARGTARILDGERESVGVCVPDKERGAGKVLGV